MNTKLALGVQNVKVTPVLCVTSYRFRNNAIDTLNKERNVHEDLISRCICITLMPRPWKRSCESSDTVSPVDLALECHRSFSTSHTRLSRNVSDTECTRSSRWTELMRCQLNLKKVSRINQLKPRKLTNGYKIKTSTNN